MRLWHLRFGLAVVVLLCISPAWAQTAGAGGPMFSPRPQPHPLTRHVLQTDTPPAASSTASSPAPATDTALPLYAPAPVTAIAPQQPTPAASDEEAPRRELTNDVSAPFYVLHPGDTVDVTFRYTPEFNDEVVIGPDGRAALKSTGDIMMAGRTLPELRRLIVSGSSAKLVNPDVAVSLKDFERPNVVVAGEVANPQRIELRRPTTVLQAILIAGGPKDDAALGRVLLFRRIDSDTAEVHVLKLGRYDAKTRAQNDLQLEPNDMILVRHDNVSRIERYVKLANVGVYFNPIGNNGLF